MNNLVQTKKPAWEDLDKDLEQHSSSAPVDEAAAVNEALDLQLVSIRLQKGLISDLKEIAEYHKIGYQPLVRDLLNRFVTSEKRRIVEEILDAKRKELEKMQSAESARQPSFEPIESFLHRERKMA